MSDTLYSASWYRVAQVRPRLRPHAHIHRHVVRGQVWYVLQDRASGYFHRFTPVANFFIACMDGKRTVQAIWDLAAQRMGEELPSQDDIIKLMSDLYRADVLVFDATPDNREHQQRQRKHKWQKWKQYIGNPLALRIPLFDPDALLTKLCRWSRPLWGWPAWVLWLAVVSWGLTLAVLHWPALTSNTADQVFSFDNLLILGVAFPVVKFVHELAHGLLVKARGGEVREMGVMLLLFMPVPYVDASAATAFPDKRWRALVGAAGMLADLATGALALWAWTLLEPGLWRAAAFNAILISAASTLFFNGNPLLRYDGYYILADWIEVPNLGQRANQYLGYLLQRYGFGLEAVTSPVTAHGERGWLAGYAVASFLYRMFMMVMIALLVAGQFFFIGVLLAVWSVVSMLLLPLGKQLKFLFTSPRLREHRLRAVLVVGVPSALLLSVLMFWPVSSTSHVQGVVWTPEAGQVRAGAEGEVLRLLAKPNAEVQAGQPLVEVQDPTLRMREAVLLAQQEEVVARRAAARVEDRVRTDLLEQQLLSVDAELQTVRSHMANLILRAPRAGIFVLEQGHNLPGQFVKRGQLLGHVVDHQQPVVRAVVTQADVARVVAGIDEAQVRTRNQPGRILTARVIRQVPSATDELPSPSLSLAGGGDIGIDPSRPGGNKALETLFLVDLALPAGQDLGTLGSRVHVRFTHASEPLGRQWWRAARRVVLSHVGV
jgi:putative peptide zinc metalloprotease protein